MYFLNEGFFEKKEDPNKVYIHKSEVSKLLAVVSSECISHLSKVYKVTHWTTFTDADKLKHNKPVSEIPFGYCSEKEAKNYKNQVYEACSPNKLKDKLGNISKFYNGIKFGSLESRPVLIIKLKNGIFYSAK